MKRLVVFLVVAALACFLPVLAQESESGHKAAEGASESSEGAHGGMEGWKWANFLLLAAGLGYLIGKNAGPFFAARSRKIQQEMAEALALHKEAEQQVAAVDARLANLESEIAALRDEAKREEADEAERIRQLTEAELAKIQSHAEQEIAAASRGSRMELRRYAAELAVGLAEQKIRSRMNPETQDALVQAFLSDLQQPSGPARTT